MKNFESFLNSSGELIGFNFNNNDDLIVRVTDETDTEGFSDYLEDIGNIVDRIIMVSFWNPDGSMYDGEPAYFPEILNCDEYENLSDEADGYLMYLGEKTIPQLKNYFRDLGFTVSDTPIPPFN